MTYQEATNLVNKKSQEFIEFCDNNDVENIYGMTPEEEKSLEKKFTQAGVFNTNYIVHQNYQNYRIINLNSGLYFVPLGLLTGDISLITQMPVSDDILKSSLFSVVSKNITTVDW